VGRYILCPLDIPGRQTSFSSSHAPIAGKRCGAFFLRRDFNNVNLRITLSVSGLTFYYPHRIVPLIHPSHEEAIAPIWLAPIEEPEMLSVIAGGRDVSRSAERAPFVARPFDRLAVGVITATNSITPDPRTLAGADGRRSTPSLLAVGAKSDGASPPSSVGAASERNVGVHESRQAVPYSPWAVRRSGNSLRSIYP